MIRGLEQKSHRGVLGILVATVLLGSALPCLAQPFVNGQNWTSVAVGGGSLQFNTDGDAALAVDLFCQLKDGPVGDPGIVVHLDSWTC